MPYWRDKYDFVLSVKHFQSFVWTTISYLTEYFGIKTNWPDQDNEIYMKFAWKFSPDQNGLGRDSFQSTSYSFPKAPW